VKQAMHVQVRGSWTLLGLVSLIALAGAAAAASERVTVSSLSNRALAQDEGDSDPGDIDLAAKPAAAATATTTPAGKAAAATTTAKPAAAATATTPADKAAAATTAAKPAAEATAAADKAKAAAATLTAAVAADAKKKREQKAAILNKVITFAPEANVTFGDDIDDDGARHAAPCACCMPCEPAPPSFTINAPLASATALHSYSMDTSHGACRPTDALSVAP
jgi:hypothetical protein